MVGLLPRGSASIYKFRMQLISVQRRQQPNLVVLQIVVVRLQGNCVADGSGACKGMIAWYYLCLNVNDDTVFDLLYRHIHCYVQS
jgi:hypothetical protein